jgi:glycerophosphoryl diester phosphodiesterase
MTEAQQHPVIVHHMAALDGTPFPPNSLEAIRACLEAGAAFIEIDVMPLAADDYLLVHDAALDRETSGSGAVSAAAPADARGLNIRRRGGEITAYRPPLLSEVVALFGEYPGATRLQIDYKSVFPMADDEPLRRFIRLIEPLGSSGRVLTSSGADWHLRWMRRHAPWLDVGFDIGFYLDYRAAPGDPRQPPYTLGAYGYHDDHILAKQALLPAAQYLAERCEILRRDVAEASRWYVDHHLITRCLDDGFNLADWLHEHGVRLDGWTLDVGKVPDADLLRLRAAGIDQFTSNTPRALAALFAASPA